MTPDSTKGGKELREELAEIIYGSDYFDMTMALVDADKIIALIDRERRKAVSDAFGKMYDTGTNHFNATFWDDVEDVLTAMFPSQP